MEGHGGPVEQTLLAVPEGMFVPVQVPVVTPVPLFARPEVAVRLRVHLSHRFVLFARPCVHHLLRAFAAECRHAKGEVRVLTGFRPLVSSFIALGERLLQLRGVLALLYVVELVRQTLHGLSLYHLRHVLRSESLLAETVLIRHGQAVIHKTRVDLLYTRLVLETFSVALDILWSARLFALEDISLQTVLSTIAAQSDHFASCSDVWNGVYSACFY